MSKQIEIRVVDVTLDLASEERRALLTCSESAHCALSSHDLLALGVVVERAMWRLEDYWLRNKAAALRDEVVAENPDMSAEDLKALLLETLSVGEHGGDGTSAARWMLTFLEMNSARPDLVVGFLCELQHRESSVKEFFLTDVYSNTNNIGANLHLLDCQRALSEEVLEEADEGLQRVAKALLSDLHYELGLDGASRSEQQLWAAFEKGLRTWTPDDLLAVQRLSQQLRSRQELFGLAALTQSLSPLALYHYWHCLILCESKTWKHVIGMERQYAAEGLLPHYRVLDVCLAVLCRAHDIMPIAEVPCIEVSDVQSASTHLPFLLDGRLARAISQYVKREGLSEERLQELSEALCYLEGSVRGSHLVDSVTVP